MQARRGISDLVAALLLLGIVAVGGYVVYNYFQSNAAAVSSANIQVYAAPVGDYIQVSVKNMGTSSVKIINVTIDGVDVTPAGWENTILEPGQTLQGVVAAPSGLAPGSHTITVAYEVDGQILVAASEFTK